MNQEAKNLVSLLAVGIKHGPVVSEVTGKHSGSAAIPLVSQIQLQGSICKLPTRSWSMGFSHLEITLRC